MIHIDLQLLIEKRWPVEYVWWPTPACAKRPNKVPCSCCCPQSSATSDKWGVPMTCLKIHESLMGFNANSWDLIAFIIACHGFEWNAGHFEYENPKILGGWGQWSWAVLIFQSLLVLKATKCQLPCSVYCRQESPCHWYTRWEAHWLINTCAVSASLKYRKWYRGFPK